MKKLLILIFAGMLLCVPNDLVAKKYKKHVTEQPLPTRMPVVNTITISVDEMTGEVSMYFGYAIEELTISLVKNGVTLDSLEISVVQGETVEYQLESYDVGEYTLVLETPEGTLVTCGITIED